MKLVVAEKMEAARLKRAATLAAMEEKRLAEIAAREAHEQKYAPLRAELYRRHEWYEKVSRWPAMGVRQPVIDTEIAAETARREAFGDISVEDAEAALSKPSANDLAAALAAALKNGGQK
jgi:hypothetical protein